MSPRLRCSRAAAGLLLLFLTTWGAAAGGAPIQNSDNGHFYEIVPGALSWTAANTAARARDWQGAIGHLATLTTADEIAWFRVYLPELNAENGTSFWLGGYQDTSAPDFGEPGGGWRWVTLEPWQDTSWAPGEPNNIIYSPQGYPSEEHLEWNIEQGGWNDLLESAGIPQYRSAQGYAVEYEAILASQIDDPADTKFDRSVQIDVSMSELGAGPVTLILEYFDGYDFVRIPDDNIKDASGKQQANKEIALLDGKLEKRLFWDCWKHPELDFMSKPGCKIRAAVSGGPVVTSNEFALNCIPDWLFIYYAHNGGNLEDDIKKNFAALAGSAGDGRYFRAYMLWDHESDPDAVYRIGDKVDPATYTSGTDMWLTSTITGLAVELNMGDPATFAAYANSYLSKIAFAGAAWMPKPERLRQQ